VGYHPSGGAGDGRRSGGRRPGPRVSLVFKADLRPGVTDGLTAKVQTIERYLAVDHSPPSK
jgi:hypothetical protein